MKSLNRKLELERSRGDNFYNGSGGTRKKLQFLDSFRDRCKNYVGSRFLCSDFLFKLFILILPLILFFSYYPIIGLGANESMNFELSLPLIWLVLFDVLVFIMMTRERILFRGLKGKWGWLLFPVYLTFSVFWSLNSLRGILTVGILWLIYFAVYGMYQFRKLFDEEFRRKFLRWLIGSSLIICGWCFLQCILDLAGVSREYTLMCEGCTYRMFGFPHPNGFAIEPQFMGNLLLAPVIMCAWIYMNKQKPENLELESSRGRIFYNRSGGLVRKLQFPHASATVVKNTSGSDFLCFRFSGFCFFILVATLFLTFSRGAIYAFIVAMIFMSVFVIVREKKKWKKILRRVGGVWIAIILSFLFTLNLQGIMAEISPTNDTYFSGIAKVLNHLSLGVVDIREKGSDADRENGDLGVVEKPVENFGKEGSKIEVEESVGADIDDEKQAVFDGYVEESTDTRIRLTNSALEIWSKDFRTTLFGVGIGGAGWALYNNGLSPAPKEIVQNEYASLLLETGVVGISLFILTLVLIVRAIVKKREAILILTLLVAYGITLCFFSGLPNAMQIYLLTGVILLGGIDESREVLKNERG